MDKSFIDVCRSGTETALSSISTISQDYCSAQDYYTALTTIRSHPGELKTFIMVQPSSLFPIDFNVTKPRLEEQNSLVPICKMIIVAFIIVIPYEGHDQDGGSMINVYSLVQTSTSLG